MAFWRRSPTAARQDMVPAAATCRSLRKRQARTETCFVNLLCDPIFAEMATSPASFDGLLRFAAGAMLGLALVVGTAGPARADVEAAGFALLLTPACILCSFNLIPAECF